MFITEKNQTASTPVDKTSGTHILNYHQGRIKVEIPDATLTDVLEEINRIYIEDSVEPCTITLPDGCEIPYIPVFANYFICGDLSRDQYIGESLKNRKEAGL